MSFVVATFYKFVHLPDCAELQLALRNFCQLQSQLQGQSQQSSPELCGTILLAPEGINGTIAGSQQAVEAVLAYLRSDTRFADLTHKESAAAHKPFERLKVRLKREIVTLGTTAPIDQVGTYVEPQDWNDLLTDPDVLVIDTRNHYEVEIGTFKGAQNPGTDSFREFPSYVQQLDPAQHKKVAMFCTGGIRCEKASAYMRSQGFEQVYHLKGGILKYLEEIPPDASLWQGECFVFDQRVAVQHGLDLGTHQLCLSCGHPITESDKATPEYEAGISCPHCFAGLTAEKRQRQIARQTTRQAIHQANQANQTQQMP
jgi:UPF0176 protein